MAPNAATSRTPQPHPDEVAEFEAIWRGEAEGLSEADIRNRHARHTQILNSLRARTLRPGAVIATTLHKFPQQEQLAVDSVAALVRGDEEALATRGRSLLENRRVVRRRARDTAPHTEDSPTSHAR
ncbi:hypothetical protein AB0N09_05915 [Streptomyces erythrochromogenes]|uniref:hypothetical protein n=1 Tax=Streptomyces erythrochromogenes TaxID=285574 RepID=UPI0034171724